MNNLAGSSYQVKSKSTKQYTKFELKSSLGMKQPPEP